MSTPATTDPRTPTAIVDDLQGEVHRVTAILETLQAVSEMFATNEMLYDLRNHTWRGLAFIHEDLRERVERINAGAEAIYNVARGGAAPGRPQGGAR